MGGVKIVPITDLRRNFGEITENLAMLDELILTKDGRPFATLKATGEEKRRKMEEFAGCLKGTALDDDKLWKEVFKKKSRKDLIEL